MPGMDGLAVLREARVEGITTPALFLTAKAEIEDRVTGLDAGADDYLPKPFDASEMEVIWTYIGFLRKKLRQIGADIEIKTIRSLLFITLAVAGGSLLLVFALVVRQPRTQNPADRHLHERGRVGDGKRRKRMGAEHPIAIRAAVKAHFQPCHALPSGRGKPVPGAHGVFPQRCGVGDRGAVFVSGRGKGRGIHAVH